VRATRATVSTGDGLLVLGELHVSSGAQGRNAREGDSAVSALGPGSSLLLVVNNDLSTGSLHLLNGVRVGVVGQTPAVSDTVGNHGVEAG